MTSETWNVDDSVCAQAVRKNAIYLVLAVYKGEVRVTIRGDEWTVRSFPNVIFLVFRLHLPHQFVLEFRSHLRFDE